MLALFDTGKRGIQVQPKPGSYAAEKGRTQRRSLRLVDNDDRRTEYGGLDRDEQRIARIAADHPIFARHADAGQRSEPVDHAARLHCDPFKH